MNAPSAEVAGKRFVDSAAFEGLSRAGFVARALIYGIIGVLALRLAVGEGGKMTNQQGALHTVAHQPFGKVLLTLVAVGLGGYSLWRLVRAAIGHGPEGSDSNFDRVAALGSGLVYGGICVLAVEILVGAGGGSVGPKKATAGVLGWPGGRVDRRHRRPRDDRNRSLSGLPWNHEVLSRRLEGRGDGATDQRVDRPARVRWSPRADGRLRHSSGIFLIKAAVDYDPREAVGLDGALAKIVNRSYGSLLLGIVAAGLIAFALYSLSDARYRKI